MEQFYDNFLAALQGRYPNKPELVGRLTDLLRLEKESVYRRLRKDVYFSADEVMRIAGAWNISIDNIVSANPQKTRPFHFQMVEYVDPTPEDYAILEQHNRDLSLVTADPKGMSVEIVSTLPRGLYARSEHLTRFFTMKWLHKSTPERALNFSEIHIPERMRELDLEYVGMFRRISELHSIHDRRLIENLVDDIVYYRSIGMLTRDDALLLGKELLMLIDYMEEVTLTGYFPGTRNRMYFYLSHTWIETEYLLYRSKHFNLSLAKVLDRNYLASLDQTVLDKFMKMALAIKHMSVLMSGSNALQQTEFLTRQRDLAKAL